VLTAYSVYFNTSTTPKHQNWPNQWLPVSS